MEFTYKVELSEFHRMPRVSTSARWVTVSYGWFNWVYFRDVPAPSDTARAVEMTKALLQLDA